MDIINNVHVKKTKNVLYSGVLELLRHLLFLLTGHMSTEVNFFTLQAPS